MLQPRTIKIFAFLVFLCLLLMLVASLLPDSPLGAVLVAPLLSVFAMHKLGVPGLLEHDGLCGWGWCSPTVPGWLLAGALWLAAAWALAWVIGRLTDSLARR